MTLESLFHCFMSLFNLVATWVGLRDSNNINVEIIYKSNDFIIVNKPEDVFTNNHNKTVSIILSSTYIVLYYNNSQSMVVCGLKGIGNTTIGLV